MIVLTNQIPRYSTNTACKICNTLKFLQGTNTFGQTDAFFASPSDSPLQVVTDVKEDSQPNMEDEQDNCLSPLGDAYLSPNHDLHSPSVISVDSPPRNGKGYVS